MKEQSTQQQADLFGPSAIKVIADDGDVNLYPGFWTASNASTLMSQLRSEIAWEQHSVKLYGKSIVCPRLSAWYGAKEASYQYSGVRYAPLPWLPVLSNIRDKLEASLQCRFNACLANLYRNGDDGMGWHADDERELGSEPVIASVNFGASRTFALRHRDKRYQTQRVLLGHGDLLVMAGQTQQHWQHSLSKTKRQVDERINLTYRWINHTQGT